MDFFKNIKLPDFSSTTFITSSIGTTSVIGGLIYYKFYYRKTQLILVNELNIDTYPSTPPASTKTWRNTVSDTMSSLIKTQTVPDLYPILNIDKVLSNNRNLYSILLGCNYKDTPYEVTNSIQNGESIKNYILNTSYSKYNIRKPLVLTDSNESNHHINNLLEHTTNLYNKCKDGDIVFLYYSGYCDYLEEEKLDVLTIISESTPKLKIDSIQINSILDIFENPNIKLIMFIDGFYYTNISKNSHQKSHHLIISTFINEHKPTRYTNKTKVTSEIIDLLLENTTIDYKHKIWSSVNTIGSQNLIYDNI